MDLASAAAKKEKALRRLPLSLTALHLGAKGRPAADYHDTCILVEKSAEALGATREMEETHHDHHTCRELWGEMSKHITSEKRTQIRASPVLCVGLDESTYSSTKPLHLSIDTCGPKIEWLIVKAKPAPRRSRRTTKKIRLITIYLLHLCLFYSIKL